MRPFALAIVSTLILATSAFAQSFDPRWQASLSTFVSEGDYGTSDTTNLVYTSLSVRRSFPRGDVTLRIPQMKVRTTGTVVVYRGVPQTTTTVRPSATPTTRTGAAAAPVVATRQRQTTTATGLGDISVGARVFLTEDRGARPAVDLVTRIELPTGDESRGLGLGAAAAQIGVDVQKSLGQYLVALTSASFTAAGDVEGLALQNPWEYSAGLGVYFSRAVLVTASYEQWRPIVPGTPAGRDVLATGTIAAGRHVRLILSVQAPLSEQASDVAAGAGVAFRF